MVRGQTGPPNYRLNSILTALLGVCVGCAHLCALSRNPAHLWHSAAQKATCLHGSADDRVYELLQRRELLRVDQLKHLHHTMFIEILPPMALLAALQPLQEADLGEVHEVPEARVQVRLFTEPADALEVRVVDVRVDAEQALENDPYHLHEVCRKLGSIHLREDGRVVQLQSIMTHP